MSDFKSCFTSNLEAGVTGGVDMELSFLWPGGLLHTDPRGDTDTPESQESFLLRSGHGLEMFKLLETFTTLAGDSGFFLLNVCGLPVGDFSDLNL